MEGQMINSLEESRTNDAKIPTPGVSKDTYEVHKDTHQTPNDAFPNLPSRVYSDKFTVGNNSDNQTKNIIHPEKNQNWAMTQASSDIGFDSNIVPSSPLSKALALASQSPISDINEDYFESLSQSPKSYTRKIKPDATYPNTSNVSNEIKHPDKSFRTYGNDESSVSKGVLADPNDVDVPASSNGIDTKVDNNLAGIVISSGPNGHFETFEGNGDKIYPHNDISDMLMHAQSTNNLALQDELTLSLLEQQFQDSSVVPNLADFLSYSEPFYSNDIVIAQTISKDNTPTVHDYSSYSNTKQSKLTFPGDSRNTKGSSYDVCTPQSNKTNPIPLENIETTKSIDIAPLAYSSTDKLKLTNYDNETTPMSTFGRTQSQPMAFNSIETNMGKDKTVNNTENSNTTKTQLELNCTSISTPENVQTFKTKKSLIKKKQSLLLKSKQNSCKSSKPTQISLLKSKNPCKYDTGLDTKVTQNETEFNLVEKSNDLDCKQPVTTSTDMVSSQRSIQSDVGIDDIPGKYIFVGLPFPLPFS